MKTTTSTRRAFTTLWLTLAATVAGAAVVTPPLQQPYGSAWSERDAVNVAGPVAAKAPPADRSGECDADCLTALMNRYLDALAHRDYTGLPVSPNLLVTENGHVTRVGEGVWKVLEKLDAGRTVLTDPVQGQVLMIGTLQESAHQPFIFLVRLKVENRLIAEIESMVTSDVNAAQHFRPDNLAPFDPATLAVLPADQRQSRTQLLADANAMLFASDIKLTATKDCVHWENGDRLTLFGPCGTQEAARPGGLIYDNRAVRHVIVDPARGLVVSYMLKDTAPYLNPNPPDNERTPLFYQRPLTLYVVQIAKFEAGNRLAAHQLFMNAQEAGLPAVFLP